MPIDPAPAGNLLEHDVHAHLLPGMDEGSRSLSESLTMAQGLERLGVRRVCVTPHQFRMGNDYTNATMRGHAESLGAEFARAGLALEVVPSAEYMFSERFLDALERNEELMTWEAAIAGEPKRCVLIELPLREPVVGVEKVAAMLTDRGIAPVMAHPERLGTLDQEPDRVLRWRAAGWSFQLDLLSLVATYGREAQRLAMYYVQRGLYALGGSDLHRAVQIEPLVRAHAAYRQAVTAQGPSRPGSHERHG